jgi:hypothetical protein
MNNPNKARCFFKAVLTVNAIVLLASALIPSQILENISKPLNPAAGRVIAMKEIAVIKEAGSDFYFKNPYNPIIASNGSIFVADQEQILEFDQSGKYVRNYFKKGQGPGEMINARTMIWTPQGLCIQAGDPQKLLFYDSSGTIFREMPLRIPTVAYSRLIAIIDQKICFSGYDFPRIVGDPQYADVPYWIMSRSFSGEEFKFHKSFSVRKYVMFGGEFPIDPFIVVPIHSSHIAIVNTPEYSINIYDLASDSVVTTITRKYDRVETPPPGPKDIVPKIIAGGKTYTAPRQKYLNDISNVIFHGGTIWAMTSTKDNKKGTLIDVFDEAGIYRDCFYLNIPAVRYTIANDICCAVEKTPEETYVLRKYRIEWKD